MDVLHGGSGSAFKYNWAKEGLRSSEFVTPEFMSKVIEVADKLKMDPDDLMAIMAFESWFDPSNVNELTGATGLIQFMPDTAKELGEDIKAIFPVGLVINNYYDKVFKTEYCLNQAMATVIVRQPF